MQVWGKVSSGGQIKLFLVCVLCGVVGDEGRVEGGACPFHNVLETFIPDQILGKYYPFPEPNE